MSGQRQVRLQDANAEGTGVGQAPYESSFATGPSGTQQFLDPPLTTSSAQYLQNHYARPSLVQPAFRQANFENQFNTIAPDLLEHSSTDDDTNPAHSSFWSNGAPNGYSTKSFTAPASYFAGEGDDEFPMAYNDDPGTSHLQPIEHPDRGAAGKLDRDQDSDNELSRDYTPKAGDLHKLNPLKRSIENATEEELLEIERFIVQRRNDMGSQTPRRQISTLDPIDLSPQQPSYITQLPTGTPQVPVVATTWSPPQQNSSFSVNRITDDGNLPQIRELLHAKIQRANDSCDTSRSSLSEPEGTSGSVKYLCTWNCGRIFSRKWEWQRHQETREPQDAWVCTLCRQPGDAAPFIGFRKDKLFDHLRTRKHSIPKTDKERLNDLARQSHWKIPQLQRRRCGYGDHIVTSWTQWLEHLEAHFFGRGNTRKVVAGEVYYNDENRQNDARVCCHKEQLTAAAVQIAISSPADFDGAKMSQYGSFGAIAKDTTGRTDSNDMQKHGYTGHQVYHRSTEMIEFNPSNSRVKITLTIAELWKGLKTVESLGRGAFSRVQKVSHIRVGDFALKSHDTQKPDAVALQHIQREIRILSVLKHPNVVRMVTATRKSSEHSFLMWPVAHTDLNNFLHNSARHSCVSTHDIIGGLVGLARGLLYMHSKGVTHNDIRPENILLDHASFLFADFGAAASKGEHGDLCRCPRTSKTLTYQAPEVLSGKYLADKADVFSLGLVFTQLVLLLAYGPHSDWSIAAPHVESATQQSNTWIPRFQALKSGVQRLGGVVGKISGRLYQLCHAMTRSSAESRPTAAGVVADLTRLLHVLPPSLLSNNDEGSDSYFVMVRASRAKRDLGDAAYFPIIQLARSQQQRGISVCWNIVVQNDEVFGHKSDHKRPRLIWTDQKLKIEALTPQVLSVMPPLLLQLAMAGGQAMCRLVRRGGPGWPLAERHYAAFVDHTMLTASISSTNKLALHDWTYVSGLPHTLQGAIVASLGHGLEYLWNEDICRLLKPEESDYLSDVSPRVFIRQAAILLISSFTPIQSAFGEGHDTGHWTTTCPVADFEKAYPRQAVSSQQAAQQGTRLSRAIILNDLRKKCPDCVRNGSCRLSKPSQDCRSIDQDITSPSPSSKSPPTTDFECDHLYKDPSPSFITTYTTHDSNALYDSCDDDATCGLANYTDIRSRDLLGLDPLRGVWNLNRTDIDSSWWDIDSVASLMEFTYSAFDFSHKGDWD